jgi:hypothetical protein
MDRYLDLVEKHQGKPQMVALIVWDVFLEGGRYTGREKYIPSDVRTDRAEHAGKGPEVTLVERASGKTSLLALPKQSDPASAALWKPLLDAVMARLERRGWADVATFGFSTDTTPTKPVVTLYRELQPGVPWMNQAHSARKTIHGMPVAYNAHVWGARFAVDPSVARHHGWRQDRLIVFFPRSSFDPYPMVTHRLTAETNIAGEQRGFGRLGGDTWHALTDARGNRVGRITEGRFPRSSWRALNIVSAYLAPSTEAGAPGRGVLATARLEMMREGVQACEARIFIERALLQGKITDAAAKRAQDVLDQRTVDLLRALNAFTFHPHFTGNAADRHMYWHNPAILGSHWFIGSNWQARSTALYETAAEVAARTGTR